MAQPDAVKEIKMNYPKVFTGNRNETKGFIQDCELYLLINEKIYDTDMKKIGFILALINDGDASSWKEQFIEEAITTCNAQSVPFTLGAYLTFKYNLQEAFTPFDAPGDALEKTKNL